MRIALVVPGFSADADDWCIPALRHFVASLAREHEVHVFALRYPYRASRYALFGAEVSALGGGQRQGPSSAALWRHGLEALTSEHRRKRFDVVHAFWATESGALAAVAGRLLHIPMVVSLAGGELVGLRDLNYGSQLVRSERLKVRLALRLADVVTAGSAYLLALAGPWLRSRHPQSLRRAPLGVDLNMFRPSESLPPGPPRLVHVASLSPVKDQATLLKAAGLLRASGHSFVLELLGGGPLEPSLRDLANRLELADAVELRGPVPHDLLTETYRRAALFVLSSRHEAQGMSVLEAAASGLPIVGTQVGVVPELAPGAAIAVPVADPEALAEGIAILLRDAARRVRLGRAARVRAADAFGLAQSVEHFHHAYAAAITRS